MSAHTSAKRKAALCILLPVSAALLAFALLCGRLMGESFPSAESLDPATEEDLLRLSTGAYESALISMHSSKNYNIEDFSHYLGQKAIIASCALSDTEELSRYLRHIFGSGNSISHIYLCLDPELLWKAAGESRSRWDKLLADDLYSYIESHPDISFRTLLPSPSIDYWLSFSQEELDGLLDVYHALINGLSAYANTKTYFLGSEYWLMANPDNYEKAPFDTNDFLTQKIFLTTFADSSYQINPQNEDAFWDTLREIYSREKKTRSHFPDLSDYCFVFFGDSVIGNYTDTTSIPGVVKGLSGAAVYNCGLGGGSASISPDSQDSSVSLPGIVEAFAGGDPSPLPPGSQAYRGISTYLSDAPSGRRLCFVINYGLNDYFCGYAVSSGQDPYDPATFSGAVRTAVGTLRSRFPDARIILCTPSYCQLFEGGTEPHGAGSYVLEDYVAAVLSLSRELSTDILDTYHNFGINSNNWEAYLLKDQVHPNEAYRYLIGEKIGLLFQ